MPPFRKSFVTFASLFWTVALLRFFAVPPFVIDDDEAWWSAASNAMRTPWDFYRTAADHKPPGVVWFYWLVNRLIPCASDPRVVRAVYTILMIAAAGALGWIAAEFSKRKKSAEHPAGLEAVGPEPVGWITATLFLLITAVPVPKILSVTADGLIVIPVVFAYALALFLEFPGVSVVAGLILGLALLIKQTAVFFAIPILFSTYPRKWSWKEISGFALGSMLVVLPSIVGVGVQEFFFWSWTYPKEVLTTVREKLFHSNLEMTETLLIFSAATFPLLWAVIQSAKRKAFALLDFRILWLFSGIAAALLGKGLFLHYLLLFAPPLALLSGEALVSRRSIRRSFAWLGVQYGFVVVLLMISGSGVFWGTDLHYFSQLGRVLKKTLHPGERVMVWGGSALPLAYTGSVHVTRFVLPRFGVAPYATERTSEMFREEFAQDPPELVLDLHERGDNQFDNPIESEPIVASLVKDYKVYVVPTIPWAKFYFRDAPPAGSDLIEVSPAEAYFPFPLERGSWMRLVQAAHDGGWAKAREVDWMLRARASLELLSRQGAGREIRENARILASQVERPEMKITVESFLRHQGFVGDSAPFPLRSIAWWPSLALVELQPRAGDAGR